MDAQRRRLAEALGGALPDGLDDLTAEEVGVLADAVGATARRHTEALTAATDEALARVPALLRPAVRRIVGQ